MQIATYDPERLDTAKPLMNIESSILNQASHEDIQIISRVELTDLKRLRTDRNRCAHPTMQNSDERFMPSAELARVHLRNAVDFVLSRPPIQGRLAATRFLTTARDESIPSEVGEAAEYLESVLEGITDINLTIVTAELLQDMLEPTQQTRTRHQRLAAMEVLRSALPNVFDEAFEDILENYLHSVGGDGWSLVTDMIKRAPWTWDRCRARSRHKLKSIVIDADSSSIEGRQIIWDSLLIPSIREQGIQKLSELTVDAIIKHRDDLPVVDLLNEAVSRLTGSGSFFESNRLMQRLIQPNASQLDKQQISSILNAIRTNDQVSGASQLAVLISAVLEEAPNESIGPFEQWVTTMKAMSKHHVDESEYEGMVKLIREFYGTREEISLDDQRPRE